MLAREKKAKTARGKRVLRERAPQIHETAKSVAVMNGPKSSELINSVLGEIYKLKKPDSVRYSRKNQIRPFEDAASLEFITTKANAALFAIGCHQKKRPNHIVLGRTFDHHVLDMIEFEITGFKSVAEFDTKLAPQLGSRPLITFQGGEWESSKEFQTTRNLLLDFFRDNSEPFDLNLGGVERALVFTAVNGTIEMRHMALAMKNAGVKTPHVELEEVGPRITLQMRRSALAEEDARKAAMKRPKKIKLAKNLERAAAGATVARIHLGKQNLDELAHKTKLPKALRGDRLGKRMQSDRSDAEESGNEFGKRRAVSEGSDDEE